MNTKKVYLRNIHWVELPDNDDYFLAGWHRCIVIKRFGSKVWVVPISTDRNNVHYGEIPIERGQMGLVKNSKIIMSQVKSVSVENIGKFIGRADQDTIKLINDFFKREIVDFIDKAA